MECSPATFFWRWTNYVLARQKGTAMGEMFQNSFFVLNFVVTDYLCVFLKCCENLIIEKFKYFLSVYALI